MQFTFYVHIIGKTLPIDILNIPPFGKCMPDLLKAIPSDIPNLKILIRIVNYVK